MRSSIVIASLAGATLFVNYAYAVEISNVPPYLTNSAKHNLMLVVDDSGSMDYELMYTQSPTVDGVMWWNHKAETFFNSDGTLYDGSGATRKYTMLFPNGTNPAGQDKQYDGRRMDSRNQAIPPIRAYAFTRSPQFNGSYYDPQVDYLPWPSVGGYSFSDSNPKQAMYDPLANVEIPGTGKNPYGTALNQDNTLDITQTWKTSGKPDGYRFYGHEGMICYDNMKECQDDGYLDFEYFLPTVYIKQNAGFAYYTDPDKNDHEIDINNGVVTKLKNYIRVDCSISTGKPEIYRDFTEDDTDVVGVADAFAPDGSCLRKYEIKPGSAMPTGRSYKEEIQNFANWFTYHRRRHQISRAAISTAMQDLSSFYAGQFWFNQRTAKVEMQDLAVDAQKQALFKSNYEHVISKDSTFTLIKEALEHAGKQYQRTTDPIIENTCQQNFSLLFTDGYSTTTQDFPIDNYGNADRAGNKGAPFADNASNTLADIAYTFQTANMSYPGIGGNGATRTLDDACSDANPPKDLDCNPNPHMNTFTIGFGAVGNIFGVSHNSVAEAYQSPPVWPSDTQLRTKGPQHIDDLYHAAVNGKGQAYSAKSAQALTSAITAAINDIGTSSGKGARIAFSSASTAEDYKVYTASYSSEKWSGDVKAYLLDNGVLQSTPEWSAADKLKARNYSSSSKRDIITYSKAGTKNQGVPFGYVNGSLAHLDLEMRNDLATAPDGTFDIHAEKRIRYFFGDRDNEGEGKLFRERGSVLGDIINSAPIYVGAPKLKYPDLTGFGAANDRYSTFKQNHINRKGVVYVGSNDGMLHAFNADDGSELFAYIPSFLASSSQNEGLHYLTDPDYEHRYYVDGIPKVVDVYTSHNHNGALSNAAWRTMLAGSTGYGGKGVFLLDITDVDDFSSNNARNIVEWEFTHDDLGQLKGSPVITKTHNNKWSVIFGNGYNSLNGKTGIFILDIEGGMDGQWSNTDYRFIELDSSDGLGDITVIDLNGDHVADRIFAGDLAGNMWVVDISATNATQWGSAYTKQGNKPAPLFQAKDSRGLAQPITVAPVVAKHPTASPATNGHNLLIAFGTGKFFAGSDATNTDAQSFYVLWDNGSSISGRSELEVRAITNSGNNTRRNVTGTDVNWATKKGWYADLPDTGERLTTEAIIRGGVVRFNTNVPENDPCQAGGYSWSMAIPLSGDIDNSRYFDTDNSGKVDDGDDPDEGQRKNAILGKPECIDNTCYSEKTNDGSGTGIDEQSVEDLNFKFPQGRLSWRQLINEN